MHPITQDERNTLYGQHYTPHVRVLLSTTSQGINQPGVVNGTGYLLPANRRGIIADRLELASVMADTGVPAADPFLGATINADLDSPVQSAEITLDIGYGARNLSPYMSLNSPAWDWAHYGGAAGTLRPLLDVGVYVALEVKLVSDDPRTVTPSAPTYQAFGPVAASSGATGVDPKWPAHIAGDVALLIVETAAEAVTLSVPAGFVAMPDSPQTTGTAGASDATRLSVYWCRATSNAMATPHITQAGNHVVAQIVTFRGCIATGNPYDVNSVGSVLATASTAVTFPALTLISSNNLVVHIVSGATDTSDSQGSGFTSPTMSMTKRGDIWRNIGNGGGFTLATGVKSTGGSLGSTQGGAATLATSTKQARLAIALRPPLPHVVIDTLDSVRWRPFFTGRIDHVDPAAEGGTVLSLKCRDIYADVLDSWIRPGVGDSSVVINTETQSEGGSIEALLTVLFSMKGSTGTGHKFAVIGEPGMDVPTYRQEPMSVLLAMRVAGLQNGWDLRPRYGTSPYGEDVLVLTYYEPDRARVASEIISVLSYNYYEIPAMGLSRDEVRNAWRVTPSDPPRLPVEVEDANSVLKYGPRWASISEDATTLVRTNAQAQNLAAALLSDTKEPKTMAEVVMRLFPWVEINDYAVLFGNGVHHDGTLELSVSGYTHSLTPDGDGTTTLRTRDRAAAANREWRRTQPKRHFVSTEPPSGTAAEGARWTKTGAT